MKRYTTFMAVVLLTFVVLALGINLTLWNTATGEAGKPYNVEINRIMAQLEQGQTVSTINLGDYPHITQIATLPRDASATERETFFNERTSLVRLLEAKASGGDTDASTGTSTGSTSTGTGTDSAAAVTAGSTTGSTTDTSTDTGIYVRFTYADDTAAATQRNLLLVDGVLLVVLVFLASVLLYLRQRLIKPFETFSALPEKLARGVLDEPLREQKSRFFGRFVWGLDNLRASLALEREQALMLERERKTLSLALLHDIKTPLAAIQLYATALQEGLYVEPKKQQEALTHIINKTHEVEDCLNQMVRSSSEDFLAIEVRNGEFYLDDLLAELQNHSAEKLKLLGVALVTDQHANSIVSGDRERTLEALENIIENALKYGDGRPIELSFAVEEGALLLAVANTGNKLPASEVAHIFESFWRGSNTQGQSGNGLGLFIVRQIVHQMDGDVYATVQGDTFSITLVLKLL